MPKRTLNEDGSAKANGIATPHGPLGRGTAQLELPMGSAGNERIAARARAIVDSLGTLSSEEVFAAFEELDQLPSEIVRAALEGATGPAPDPERLDDAIRRAHGFPARALGLRTMSVTKDADIFDLGSIAEEQLRIAGRAWDGRDLEPEERLDGEAEDSFAGTLERHVLVDVERPDAPPMFEVLLYAGDAGTIFRAGTTEVVGAIAYGVVEMKDSRARVAIQEALARPFEPERRRDAPTSKELRTAEAEPAPPKRAAKATKKRASAPKKAAPPPAPKKAATKKVTPATAPKKKSSNSTKITDQARNVILPKKTKSADRADSSKAAISAKKSSSKKAAAAKEPAARAKAAGGTKTKSGARGAPKSTSTKRASADGSPPKASGKASAKKAAPAKKKATSTTKKATSTTKK